MYAGAWHMRFEASIEDPKARDQDIGIHAKATLSWVGEQIECGLGGMRGAAIT